MSQPARTREVHPDDEAYPREARQPAAAPRPRKPAGPVAVEVVETIPRAIGASPAPWWFAAPKIFERAFHVVFMPFKLLVMACEVAVSVAFTGMLALVALWWFKIIPDSEVWIFISSLSERVQGIAKGAGLL
jgi:hypothetical protein